jgi:hypothetical protein
MLSWRAPPARVDEWHDDTSSAHRVADRRRVRRQQADRGVLAVRRAQPANARRQYSNRYSNVARTTTNAHGRRQARHTVDQCKRDTVGRQRRDCPQVSCLLRTRRGGSEPKLGTGLTGGRSSAVAPWPLCRVQQGVDRSPTGRALCFPCWRGESCAAMTRDAWGDAGQLGQACPDRCIDLSIALTDVLHRAAFLSWSWVGSIRRSRGFGVVPRWWPSSGVHGRA